MGSVQEIPAIVERKVQEIPRYEDQSIKFQGKYKVQTGDNSYELKGQQTRWYAFGATALGSTTFTRENKGTTRFVCTKAVIHSYGKGVFGVSRYEQLMDSVNGVNSGKIVFWVTASAQDIVIDMTDCPRIFEGDFVINKGTAGGAEYTAFVLYGWEEQL